MKAFKCVAVFAYAICSLGSALGQSNEYSGKLGDNDITVSASFDEGAKTVSGYFTDETGSRYRFEGTNRIQGRIQIRVYAGSTEVGRAALEKEVTADVIMWTGRIRWKGSLSPFGFGRPR